MKTWYGYNMEIIGYNPPIPISFKLCLEIGENILNKGYFYVQGNLMKSLEKNYQSQDEIDIKKFIQYLKSSTKVPKALYSKMDNATDKQDLSNIIYPLESIKTRFSIKCISEIHGCMGCCYETLGQSSHMECPDGCLHEKEECETCKNSEPDIYDIPIPEEDISPGSKKRKRDE